MIEEINIENLGVIARASFPLAPGFTVLTGETGAGKSMILNALSLLRGGKSDTALIRTGASELVVEGRWDASAWPSAIVIMEEAGGNPDDDGSIITARTVSKTKSRAHLGGRSVPAATMADFTAELVTVHGQADQMRLRTPARQREALDSYSDEPHRTLLKTYKRTWERHNEVSRKLTELTSERTQRQQLAQLLTDQLAEVEAVDPQVGEHAELSAQISRLTNSHALQLAVGAAYQALTGNSLTFGDGGGGDFGDDASNITQLMDRARRELSNAVSDDVTIAPLAERLTEVGYLIADLSSGLASYASGLDVDPAQLEQLQNRLAALNTLARKHGMSADEVVAWAQQASLQLLDLSNDDDVIDALTKELTDIANALEVQTETLTIGRKQTAEELALAVSTELAGLGMANSAVQITVEPTEPGPTGADLVTFHLVPHPGVEPRPIAKGASGGELSRLMLAIELTLATKRVTSETTPLPTFVFDEVDAGVGGKAATEIGKRLKQLAQLTQVIVVTHLAQVAAYADQQLVVDKQDGETTVAIVAGKDREREIARMLSGADDSATALKHARELLGEQK
jgi:DNA repair protein RecN (Recombination protein N)